MREFSVYITGIMSFVEDYRRAVAVNASRPIAMTVSKGPGLSENVTVPAHFPYVRIPINYLDDTMLSRFAIAHDWDISAAPGVFPIQNPDDPESVIRQTVLKFLHFHEVVLPASDTPPSVDDTPLNDTGIPDHDTDGASIGWLASMESLGTPAKTIDPRHVVKDPLDVAAYIRFPQGEISTAVATNFKFVSVSAFDGRLMGTLHQAVAQLLVCTLEVPDDEFTVSCRDYRSGDVGDFDITFRAGVPEPWMVFACTSLDDAFQLPSVDEKYGTDTHFRLVYGLAKGIVTDVDIALPKSLTPAPNSGPARPLGSGHCIPIGFTGGAAGGQQ
jgi:hypothetical protein